MHAVLPRPPTIMSAGSLGVPLGLHVHSSSRSWAESSFFCSISAIVGSDSSFRRAGFGLVVFVVSPCQRFQLFWVKNSSDRFSEQSNLGN